MCELILRIKSRGLLLWDKNLKLLCKSSREQVLNKNRPHCCQKCVDQIWQAFHEMAVCCLWHSVSSFQVQEVENVQKCSEINYSAQPWKEGSASFIPAQTPSKLRFVYIHSIWCRANNNFFHSGCISWVLKSIKISCFAPPKWQFCKT